MTILLAVPLVGSLMLVGFGLLLYIVRTRRQRRMIERAKWTPRAN